MNRRQLLMIVGALGSALALPGCAGAAPGGDAFADIAVPAPDAGVAPQPSPLDAFAADLTARLAPEPRNLVWSPWSVAMVLAMVRDGAAGATASELTAVLRAGDDVDARLADGWRRMAHAQGEPLHAGNAVWVQRTLAWKQPFLDRLAALSASLKGVDYTGERGGIVDEINRWVAGRTAGKITGLLEAGMLSADTRMVLVNAVHFKAAWVRPLTEVATGTFRTPAGTVQAPYLSSPRSLTGRSADGWTSALLPCEHEEFGLVVALADDPAAAPSSAPMAALTGVGTGAGGVQVLLTLPAWKQRFRALLNDLLSAAGMPSAFDPDAADFSAMTDAERLFLKLVVHEATIEVNAKGIEATAATAAVMERATGTAEPPVPLVLDRPFAYALVHLPTRTPVFVGQVADPTKTG